MSRRVKEFIDIGEHISLDELIGKHFFPLHFCRHAATSSWVRRGRPVRSIYIFQYFRSLRLCGEFLTAVLQ